MDIPERRDKLNKLAAQIAKHIPDWKLAPLDPDMENQDRRFLVKGQMRIGISLDWSKPRVNIGTWEWPSYQKYDKRYNGAVWVKEQVRPSSLYDPQEDAPDITVSDTKSPEQIAADIKRRFIPQYQHVWDRLEVIAKQHGEYEQKSRAVWVRACKALGLDDKHESAYLNGHIQVEHRGEHIHVQFDTDPDTLAEIVAMLKSKAKGRPAA